MTQLNMFEKENYLTKANLIIIYIFQFKYVTECPTNSISVNKQIGTF